jgi:beta-N-acetylglucosaminidase
MVLNMKNKTFLFIFILFFFIAATAAIDSGVTETPNQQVEITQDTVSLDTLISEVDTYIQTVAPGSNLSGYAVVDACLKYDMDIVFVLAQGQKESHFGTAGIARKTNSVFNVMSYDNRSADEIISRGHGYSHPDQSVEPYMRLIRNDYMVDGKTTQDLMICFVNKNGHRYASNPHYEKSLQHLYDKINNTTRISELYNKCTSYNFH